MDNGKYKKSLQLGQPHSTAVQQLRKMILFQLVQETGKDICYQCKETIDTIDNFSIEHKDPWLNSDNPKEKFFDLNNIAFSHMTCNFKAARNTKKIISPEGYGWCWSCKQHKLLNEFPPSKLTRTDKGCTVCRTKRKLERRILTGKR